MKMIEQRLLVFAEQDTSDDCANSAIVSNNMNTVCADYAKKHTVVSEKSICRRFWNSELEVS